MKIILTDVMSGDQRNAGSKARNDVRDILEKKGYQVWTVFDRNLPGLNRAIQGIKSLLSLVKTIEKDSWIVLQYPYNIKLVDIFVKILNIARENKNCKVILLIHDIYYLRNDQRYSPSYLQKKEVRIFNNVDYIVVHNKKMLNKLSADGVKTSMIPLEIFDYLPETLWECTFEPDEHERTLVYAGAFGKGKSRFVYNWKKPEGIRVILYGKVEENVPDDYDYRGSEVPEKLPAIMNKNKEIDYGLVWDGNCAETIDGNYGEYLKYNNPHKASLYIAAGLPLVVWKHSAICDFVEKYGIGRGIESLEEIPNLPEGGSEEYMAMREKVMILSNKVKKGEYLLGAMERALGNGIIT